MDQHQVYAHVLAAAGLRPLWWSIYREAEREAWEPGSSTCMGDLVSADEAVSVRATDRPDFYEVPVTVWGDYCGDICGRSNHRSLLRDYPELFSDVVGGYDSHFLVLPAQNAPDTEEVLADLVPIVVALRDDYPLYDEEDESALEMELADEAWDCYLGWDVRRDLEAHGLDTDEVEDETLRDLFYELVAADSIGYEAESATGVYFPHYSEIVAEMVERLS